jgi:precorrin-8X/cobalt-precorrin-8 methylmutase
VFVSTIPSVSFLVVSHGSPRADVNGRFVALVERIAARVAGDVLPAFFSIARPNIPDQVAVLAARGTGRIVLMPYFLGAGQHVSADIPALLAECRERYPHIAFDMLPTLESDPVLEDLVVDRLTPLTMAGTPLPSDGASIEARSYEIIDRQLATRGEEDPAVRRIVRRVIHATADLSFSRSMRVHPQAVSQGLAALASGAPVICDVHMLRSAATKVKNEVLCAIDDPQARSVAAEKHSTRAAAAMEVLSPWLAGSIVAVGNAPTALWKVLEIAAHHGPAPALVIGLPVGLVGARESKAALLASGLCYITNTTSRGGSPAAAAVLNALAMLAEETK